MFKLVAWKRVPQINRASSAFAFTAKGRLRRRALEAEQRALAKELNDLGTDPAHAEARRALLTRMQESARALREAAPRAGRKEKA